MNKILKIEQIMKMSQEEIVDAYRKGYRIEGVEESSTSKLGPATCPGEVPLNSIKTATGSASGGTPGYTFSWTIKKPDGTTESKTGASFTYTFSMVGTYTISMTVTDAAGKTCPDSCSISVTAPAPSCSFTVT